jgi:hypothetical protein
MKPAALSIRRTGALLFALAVSLHACNSTGPALTSGQLPDGAQHDPNTPAGPDDTLPGDSTPAPPTDSLAPPPDSLTPPPDTTAGGDPSYVPVHQGIPFGPFALPSRLYGPEFSGAYRPAWTDSVLVDLEAARRASTRVVLNLTGADLNDATGFSLTKWKQRVDRFRGLDLTSYIDDGTIVGHFLIDEPNDASNWKGHRISPAEVDEMAKYSKEIWPTMATLVRGWPAYLKGYQYQYLDAAWAQYHFRFGPIDKFIAENVRDAQSSGLALVAGMNVLNGGSSSSGIPGRRSGKYGMSASELRSWGNALLSEPYICAMFIWKYDPKYFDRSDIKAALSDLNQKAESHSRQACRRGS